MLRVKPRAANHASRSASELVSASPAQVKAASLPKMMKPGIGVEAMGVCTRRAFRGENSAREKIGHRNPGDPAVC